MHRRFGSRAALVGFFLTGAVSCSRHESAGVAATAASAAVPLATAAKAASSLVTPTTTAPSIALHNLEAEVSGYAAKVKAGDAASAYVLIERYLTRAQFVGRVSDLGSADEASAELLKARPGEARAHLARAHTQGALHRFGAALAELDEAARLGTPAEEITHARAPLLLGMGRLDEAAALMPAGEQISVADLIARGALEERIGHAAESDRAFELARTRYRDVSPFAVAWMDFERARTLEREGDRTRSRAYLEEASTVLPCYAHAVVHLSAMEPADKAIARLDPLEASSDDPDVPAAHADALRRAGRGDEAVASMAARARARFEAVVALWPEAFSDHAASFYLGMGRDPARALLLAKVNVANRPTDEAVELWLTAAQAADAHKEVCEAAAHGEALAHVAPTIRERFEVAARSCR